MSKTCWLMEAWNTTSRKWNLVAFVNLDDTTYNTVFSSKKAAQASANDLNGRLRSQNITHVKYRVKKYRRNRGGG